MPSQQEDFRKRTARNTLSAHLLNGRLTRPLLLAILIAAPLAVWVIYNGEPRLALQTFTRMGWGLAGIVLLRGVTVVLCGTAWGQLMRRHALPLTAYQTVRFIREGLNVLLPFTGVGGDILGMRLITFWGLSGGLAIASVTVDVTLQAAAQAVFTLFGLALLSQIYGTAWLQAAVLGGVAALGASLVVFQQLQRRGIQPLRRLLERAVPGGPLREVMRSPPMGLQSAFTEIWNDRASLVRAGAIHLTAWLVGIVEVWIALRCMGHPQSWAVAAMLETLSQGLRSLAFPVPAGIGVQEGSLIGLGHLLGLEPGVALAISMVKRVPDLVLGLPALAAWLGLEARHPASGGAPP